MQKKFFVTSSLLYSIVDSENVSFFDGLLRLKFMRHLQKFFFFFFYKSSRP